MHTNDKKMRVSNLGLTLENFDKLLQSVNYAYETFKKLGLFYGKLVKKGYIIIAQEYVKPGRIKALLRKKGTNLEPVKWYNRICVKYVCENNPNQRKVPAVALIALEVTLGPDIIPAGRKCAFTAGKFAEDK